MDSLSAAPPAAFAQPTPQEIALSGSWTARGIGGSGSGKSTLLWQVADRVAVLAEGKVQGIGSMSELSRMDNPAIRQFFDGARGRAAQADTKKEERPSKPR